MSTDTLAAVDAATITALAAELRELLGPDTVSDEEAALDRVSIDGSTLSPVVSEQLPLGRAQLVVYPPNAEAIAIAVGAAVRHRVPITPRGKGTGNYGQGIPMSGGLVIDTSKARAIVEVGDGYLVAEAGAPMIQLEQAANRTGQQLLMFPSTVQSTIGGFVSGGSGGTGSIRHGMLHQGYVRGLDVVHAEPDATLIHLDEAASEAYLHNYGTAGIIARVELHLEPAQNWSAFLASFDDFHDAFAQIRALVALDPTPRLVSSDLPMLADALPADTALPKGKASLRAILDDSTIDEATRIIEAAGGTVEAVRPGLQATMKLSMTSYNHPIEWLQKAYPGTYFHIEVAGDALVDRIDEVHQVYPGAMLHIEGQRGRPIGMLAAPYTGADDVWAGFPRMDALGVGFHNPHQWFVDHEPERSRALAATTDPLGLLNPGKLVDPTVDTGRKRVSSVDRNSSTALAQDEDWPDDPLKVLRAWLPSNDDPARPLMTVATVDASGAPDSRTQLLTAWDEHGLYFHTDSRSRKVEQLRGEPRVALCLHLPADARQITVQGTALPAAEHELEWAYAHRSPYLQQLAWQNDAGFAALPLADRLDAWERFAEEHRDGVSAPDTWAGYVVRPVRLTFWVGSAVTASRRTEYSRTHDGWTVSHLAG